MPSVEEGGDGIFIPFQGMVYSIGDKVSGQDALLMEYCNLHFTNLINEALLRTNEARRRGDTMPRAPLFLGDRVEPARPPQRVRDPAQAAGGDKGKGKKGRDDAPWHAKGKGKGDEKGKKGKGGRTDVRDNRYVYFR